MNRPDFQHWPDRWALTPDGEPIVTRSSRLLPVRRNGEPLMLKIAVESEEKRGARLMVWWNEMGAARVLEHDDEAVLLERATGSRSLADMAANGEDDEASRIICATVARLHARRETAAPELVPLSYWFRSLDPIASREGGILLRSAVAARTLLSEPRDVRPLHGDIHHGNILDFAERGWLAIDPKSLVGERGFDYGNLFCNPDRAIATSPGRFERQMDVVAEAAQLERGRLMEWVLAWAGLSAAWSIEDGEDEHAALTLRIAELAAAALDRTG